MEGGGGLSPRAAECVETIAELVMSKKEFRDYKPLVTKDIDYSLYP